MSKVETRGPARRHVPQRTCVACGSETAKRALVRVVRTPEGRVTADPTGKKAGRGAYVCARRECWETALAKGRLERSLHVRITAEDAETLRAYAAGLGAWEGLS